MSAELDAQCEKLVRNIPRLAVHMWRRDGRICDLEEYIDAGYEALLGCLERWDPAQAQFNTYASHRIKGAMQDCARRYHNWRRLRQRGSEGRPHQHLLRPPSWEETMYERLEREQLLAQLPDELRRFAADVDEGYTQREACQRQGSSRFVMRGKATRWLRQHAEELL